MAFYIILWHIFTKITTQQVETTQLNIKKYAYIIQV